MTATPRNLDPKFKDATTPDDADVNRTDVDDNRAKETKTNEREETASEALARLGNSEVPNDPHEGFITYRQRFVDSSGNAGEKIHGPMPVSEWADYSREHGL